ncbi:MAG: acyl carrier protein [Ruminiclostridium sp.]
MSTLERLKKLFVEIMPQTDVSDVNAETSITNDLGVDSLRMVMLAIVLEEEFDIRLNYSDRFSTVGDIISFIDNYDK